MATGMFGANVELLMQVGREFDLKSEVTRNAGRTVESEINGVEWVGSDAQNYRSTYGDTLKRQLDTLADINFDARGRLEDQAQAQEDASRGGDGCLQTIGNAIVGFFEGLFVDGIWEDIQGILGLVGISFEGGFSWNWDNFFGAWGGLISGVAGLVGIDLTGQGRGFWQTLGDSWGGMLGDFFAVDMWADDPASALGKVIWNVGSIFIPGYNIAKVFKILRKADTPAPKKNPEGGGSGKGDGDSGSGKGDGDSGNGDSGKGDSGSGKGDPPEAPGGPPNTLPPGYRVDPDTGDIIAPNGSRFDTEHQRNNIPPKSPELNRDVTDRDSRFESDTVYTTSDGQTFITNGNGQVEYSSITRTNDELTGTDRSGMGKPAKDYWDYDSGDQRGHHNPAFMGATNDNINLTPQSPGSNAGTGRGQNSPDPSAHQNALEQRTQQYMQQNPSEPVTWERQTIYDENGHASGYNIRVTDGDGNPIDLSQQGTNQPHLKPDEDGWVYVAD